jgi:hypothetical protein
MRGDPSDDDTSPRFFRPATVTGLCGLGEEIEVVLVRGRGSGVEWMLFVSMGLILEARSSSFFRILRLISLVAPPQHSLWGSGAYEMELLGQISEMLLRCSRDDAKYRVKH